MLSEVGVPCEHLLSNKIRKAVWAFGEGAVTEENGCFVMSLWEYVGQMEESPKV